MNLLSCLRKRSSRQRGTTARRLASEVALLDSLDHDRARFNDPAFGKMVEQSIIWRRNCWTCKCRKSTNTSGPYAEPSVNPLTCFSGIGRCVTDGTNSCKLKRIPQAQFGL